MATVPTDAPDPDGAGSMATFATWLTATAGLAPGTVRAYTGHLSDYQRWWHNSRPQHRLDDAEATDVEDYLAHLTGRGLTASTRRTALHALRAYYRWTLRHTPAGPGGNEPSASNNPALAVRRPRVAAPRTVIYTEAQADAILAAASARIRLTEPDTPQRARAELDHAVLAMLRWTGMRSAELRGLTLADVDLDARQLHVLGKGSKHRDVPVSRPLMAVLTPFLTRVRPTLLGHDGRRLGATDVLLCNPASPTGQLSSRALLDICRRHGHQAAVGGAHTPLRWRHTFASHTLARGVDLHSLSRLMGHASLSTTERYLHLDSATLSTALERAYP